MAMTYDPEAVDDSEIFSGQEESYLSSGDNQRPYARWYNGTDMAYLVQGAKGMVPSRDLVAGWHFEEESLSPAFLDACQKLTEGGYVKFVTIRHSDKSEKNYVVFTSKMDYYVLTHGTPSKYDISEKLAFQVGLAAGSTLRYHGDKIPPTYTLYSFLSVLVVPKQLYEIGYSEDGMPPTVILYVKNQYSDELYQALRKHATMLLRVLGKTREAQYWGYSQQLQVSETTVTHGKIVGKKKDVYIPVSGHPEQKQWTPDYVQSLRADDDLYGMLELMTCKTLPDGRIIPGGDAIGWCRSVVKRAVLNQDEWNPRDPKTGRRELKYGTHTAPQTMILHANKQKNVRVEEDTDGATPSDPFADYRSDFQKYLNFFNDRGNKEGVRLAREALKVVDNELGLDESDILTEADGLLTKLAALRKQASTAPENAYE